MSKALIAGINQVATDKGLDREEDDEECERVDQGERERDVQRSYIGDRARNQEEAQAPSENARQDKRPETNVEHPSGDREDLVWDGREGPFKYQQSETIPCQWPGALSPAYAIHSNWTIFSLPD